MRTQEPHNSVCIPAPGFGNRRVISLRSAQPQQGAPLASIRAQDSAYAKTFGSHFQTSDRCVACHNGLSTPTGEDISIGVNWRTSMMANSGRDPYWISGVRRESIDHPTAASAIQDECTICHMPMMRYESKLTGREGRSLCALSAGPRHACRSAGRRRRFLLGLSPDHRRRSGHAREFRGRVQD